MTSDNPAEQFSDTTDEVDEASAGYRAGPAEVERAHAMNLAAVRRALNLIQMGLARSRGDCQAAITKLEHQDDMLLSTFYSYMRALHGKVQPIVHFGDGHEVEVALEPPPRRASA